jgi:hypothetical protein
VQASKAGILEIADVFVVNKADRDGAAETVRDLCGTQAQAEGLVLEVEDAHDAAIRLSFPVGRCVPEDVVGAEAVGDRCRAPVSLAPDLGRSNRPGELER